MTTATLTKPRRPVTSVKGRAKRTILLDGLELAAIVHARSAKKKMPLHLRTSPKPLKSKGIDQTDTLSLKSQGKAELQKSSLKPSNEFLGVFASRSVAEDILILRSWMASKGLREIDPMFSICEFASCFERLVRPRHAWTHFAAAEEPRARRFLAEQAAALLPEILKSGDAR